MQNRFLETSYKLRANGNGNSSSSRSFSFSTSERSYSMSVQDRVLVILIENGGVDLGIPELVDKILQALKVESVVPDAARKQLISFLTTKIKGLTDDLFETAELSINRYQSASPGLFSNVVVLRNGTASYQDLKTTLIKLTQEKKIMDVLILTHGGTDSISVTGGINGQKIRDIKTEAGKPLSIRSVYMMNCVGSTLNQAWIDAGAKVSSGAIRNNYLPEPTTFFFWSNWKQGQNFETAVTGAYRKTINLVNDIVRQAIKTIPFGSTIVGSFNFEDFDFVKDSAPVIQGLRSVTINSDDLTFTQSVNASNLATTVLPVSLLQSLQMVRVFSNEKTRTMSISKDGVSLIKRFEGFVPKPYNDAVGHCTVGYGTLLHHGNCNGKDASEQPYVNGISEEDATKLLEERAIEYQKSIHEQVNVELNQNQFDSLVSFVYNVGNGAFVKSTLLKVLNQGNYAAVPAEMKKWVYGTIDGKKTVLPGLEKRRNAEAELFAKPVSIAQSMSYKYSEPFYDTGEHAIFGEFINATVSGPIADVHELSPSTFYSINGVQFTYGQIITLGDFFEDYKQLTSTGAKELEGLKKLIIQNENFYKNSIFKMGLGNAGDPTQKEWNDATNKRYLALAAVNNSHFAPPPPESAFKSSKKANNKSSWEYYHGEAIKRARAGTNSNDLLEALKINAFGDHFLTDAFAAGHLVNKELLIEQFKIMVLTSGKVDADGTKLLSAIAKKAFVGPVADAFSKYQTSATKYKVNGFIDDANMFTTLLSGILEQKPDKIANLFVKAIHDALNSYGGKKGTPHSDSQGVPVVNAKGQKWNLTGDTTLNPKNITQIQQAVKQSVLNISDSVTNPSTSIDAYRKKVWDYVPLPGDPDTKKIIDKVIKDYSNLNGTLLIDKGVELITSDYVTLIDELINEKAIEPRQSGITHPWNTVGNFLNDHT